jgi:uncharacterized protein YukE
MTYEEIEVTEGTLQDDKKQTIDLLSNMARRLTELEQRTDRLSGVYEREINGIAKNVEMVAQEVEAVNYRQEELFQRMYHVEADLDAKGPNEPTLDADLIDTNTTSATDTSDRGQEDAVEHPSHYNTGRFETIEIIEEITQGYDDGYVSYCVGNAVKYLSRAPFKHGSPHEDINKAAKYLEFALERIERG